RYCPRQPARPAPAALGVPARAARARTALRARRHPAGADPARRRGALAVSPAMSCGVPPGHRGMDATNLAGLYDLPLIDWAGIEARLEAGLSQVPGTGG